MKSEIKEASWSGENFWIEIIEKNLYPPKAISFKYSIEALIKNEDFSGKRVLDYGCGTGQIGKLVKERGADVLGIDISDKLLDIAKKYIKVKKIRGTNLPFEDRSFDYVLAFMVLHIIEDLEKSIEEINRVLKPGGKLFFGIVHPHSEKWDLETGLCYDDKSTYFYIEERTWVFNLTDSRRFDEHYIHRPLEYYIAALSKHFAIRRLLEPYSPSEHLENKKYARLEFLFMEAIKISQG